MPVSKFLDSFNLKAKTTFISASILGLLLIITAVLLSPSVKNFSLTFAIGVCGCTLGWLTAIISSPYDKSDKDNIGRFTKLAGAFFGGYVLSESKDFIKFVLAPTQMLTLTFGLPLIFFISFFCITFIVVYVSRQYDLTA